MPRIVTHILLPFALLSLACLFTRADRGLRPVRVRTFCYQHDDSLLKAFAYWEADTNLIDDPGRTLHAFFDRLDSVRAYRDDPQQQFKVSVVHIGDSHIQAGFLTEAVRTSFHRDFGNAGRGFIAPLKLTRTNEPTDYAVTSPNAWTCSKVTERTPVFEPGLGGIGLRTAQNRVSFSITTYSHDIDYSFNSVTAFHDEKAPLLAQDPALSTDMSCPDTLRPWCTYIDLMKPVSTLELSAPVTDSRYNDPTFYGFSLENGRNGVLYHSIGVNGACFLHYGRHPRVLLKQAAALRPDLFILSMGTNEASGRNFVGDVFYGEIDLLVSEIRRLYPGVPVLLTTPPDSFRRRTVKRRRVYSVNDNLEKVSLTLRRYAADHRLACWDLYTVTGGKGSSQKWLDNGLMRADRIHYTEAGYRLQGMLLYEALTRSYAHYITHKHAE